MLCARVLSKQAVRRAAPGGSEDAGGLWDKRGCQEGGGRPGLGGWGWDPGWGRRRRKERRVRRLGPAGTCRALPGARAHPPPSRCGPHLSRPSRRRLGDPAPETHGRATRAGAEERLEAPGRSGPGRAGGGAPAPRPRRGVPPPPTWASPAPSPPPGGALLPQPRRGLGRPEPQLPVSSPPRGPSAAPSTSGAGPPPPVPAHLSRLQLWAFAGLAESSRRDPAPPGPTSGWSLGPRPRPGPPPPAPSRPIRRRVPSHALIRPRSPRPDPSLSLASPAQSYRTPGPS